jgi:LysR family transcriptional regulator, low CO2-responsive transcriptional regulator
MTLAQLKVFVLVARLGSVRAAAAALGVSEPAVSQALAALRQQLDDQLISRVGNGMELTEAGRRVVGLASQMVNLAVEAEHAVRESKGAAVALRVVTSPTLANAVVPALLQAFSARSTNIDTTLGVATTDEMEALVHERLADIAIGPRMNGLDSAPIMRDRLTLVAAPHMTRRNGVNTCRWLVDASGSDPHSFVGHMLSTFQVPDKNVRVFASDRAALSAIAAGDGIGPALEHAVAAEVARGTLSVVRAPGLPLDVMWHINALPGDRRSAAASRLWRFALTPDAMQAMRRPDEGVPVTRFRPPVYVTIWN